MALQENMLLTKSSPQGARIIDLWYQNGYNVFSTQWDDPKMGCSVPRSNWDLGAGDVQVNQVIRKEAIHLDRLTLKRFAM